jgi:hypothetical protein
MMNDKASVSKAFNKHFFDFLDDILGIFPDKEEIIYAKNAFQTIKKLNTTAIIKVWYPQVYLPYSEHIDVGNIDYFINKDYSEDISNINKASDIVKMIDNIRKPISDMDETNKQHCAKYIQNLSKLSSVYNKL